MKWIFFLSRWRARDNQNGRTWNGFSFCHAGGLGIVIVLVAGNHTIIRSIALESLAASGVGVACVSEQGALK